MAGNNIAVFGIYSTRAAIEQAVGRLRTEGFRSTDISVLFLDNCGITGGVLGWLTGIGALAIPGIGSLIAAGPIVAALAGAGALGTAGRLVGALAGLGIPDHEARRYEGRICEGEMLLSVHCDSTEWVRRAREVLDITGAQHIGSAGEKSGDFPNAGKPTSRVRKAGSGDAADENDLYEDLDEPPSR